jgi:hypothetical protein
MLDNNKLAMDIYRVRINIELICGNLVANTSSPLELSRKRSVF